MDHDNLSHYLQKVEDRIALFTFWARGRVCVQLYNIVFCLLRIIFMCALDATGSAGPNN